jgi:hypothetical protein
VSEIKFYMDGHVAPAVTHGLRLRGVDVTTTQPTAIGDQVRGLLLIHDVLTAEEMRGRVEFL